MVIFKKLLNAFFVSEIFLKGEVTSGQQYSQI